MGDRPVFQILLNGIPLAKSVEASNALPFFERYHVIIYSCHVFIARRQEVFWVEEKCHRHRRPRLEIRKFGDLTGTSR